MDFLKKITARHLWIYVGVAFVFNLILNHVLYDFLVDGLQAFYIILPAVLQKILYPVSISLAQLDPTETELSVLFAVGAVEKLGMLVKFSMIGAILWLVYKWVSKIWTKNS